MIFWCFFLFYGDRFGKVFGLVDIAFVKLGYIISQ